MTTYDYNGKTYHELEGARLVWRLSSYDGPMSGIATYQGQFYFGRCHQSPESRKPRYFWLYSLNDEELAKEIKYQEFFRKHIGLHTDYDESGKRVTGPRNFQEWLWEVRRIFRVFDTSDLNKKRVDLGINREEYLKRDAIGYFKR